MLSRSACGGMESRQASTGMEGSNEERGRTPALGLEDAQVRSQVRLALEQVTGENQPTEGKGLSLWWLSAHEERLFDSWLGWGEEKKS